MRSREGFTELEALRRECEGGALGAGAGHVLCNACNPHCASAALLLPHERTQNVWLLASVLGCGQEVCSRAEGACDLCLPTADCVPRSVAHEANSPAVLPAGTEVE